MNVRMILQCMLIFALCCSMAQAYTLTLDDIPSGNDLNYYQSLYGVTFTSGFSVVDRADSASSGTKVMTWNPYGSVGFIFADGFTSTTGYYPLHYTAHSVGAYFSTDMGVMLKMTGYRDNMLSTPEVSVLIGRPNESWSHQYAEISSEAGDIGFVTFEFVDAPPGFYTFSADDITVNPVPEPSAFAVLFVGLTGLVWRKKR